MFYRCDTNKHGLAHDPFKACVVPRPIGWISTVDAQGVPNLSPFSFFTIVNENPPMVMYCPNGVHVDGGEKDSVKNARETGEFVVNVATYALRDAMNRSSAQVPRSVDEFELAGVTAEPSDAVLPPRVLESPIHLECKVHQILDLPSSKPGFLSRMVIGIVIGIHIREDVIENGMVSLARLQPLARMGYRDYAVPVQVFQLNRPYERPL